MHAVQLASGKWSVVESVRTDVTEKGLYNVHTQDGTVVVDGVRVSCYTEAVHHVKAHGLLAVFRAMFKVGWITERTVGSVWAKGVL